MTGFVPALASARRRLCHGVLSKFDAFPLSTRSTQRVKGARICTSATVLPRAVYIHLPFCRQKCAYCNFPVVVQKPSSASSAEESYLDVLLSEISASQRAYADYPREALKSVYLGGGTPSLTSASGMERLLSQIDSAFGIDSDAEITCEMDPATFDAEKAAAYRRMGVNRASVGAQSFDDTLLQRCGRLHRSADVHEALGILRGAGFDNISLDLISGLPGQTLKTWEASLDAAIELEPSHISSYDLELEEGTPFGDLFRPGISPLPSEAHAADMLTMAHKRLIAAGWEHYELASFSRSKNLRSQHNLAYWHGEHFFGFGLGATSLVYGSKHDSGRDSFRFDRPRNMAAWKNYVAQLSALSTPKSSALYPNTLPRSRLDELQEFLMNGLRLLAGVEFTKLKKHFGQSVCAQLVSIFHQSGLDDLGHASLDVADDGEPLRLRITAEGAKFETSVLAALLFSNVWNL